MRAPARAVGALLLLACRRAPPAPAAPEAGANPQELHVENAPGVPPVHIQTTDAGTSVRIGGASVVLPRQLEIPDAG
ncbi:MAG: hypothetical protein HY909_13065 [Deltaproteobacteria bacterium]|nr:hypothetical protein [Deltaproteobacteria bacterium]